MEPSAKGAIRCAKPCQCCCLSAGHVRKVGPSRIYHGQILIRHVVVHAYPCWSARCEPYRRPRRRTVHHGAQSRLARRRDVGQRYVQNVVGREAVCVANVGRWFCSHCRGQQREQPLPPWRRCPSHLTVSPGEQSCLDHYRVTIVKPSDVYVCWRGTRNAMLGLVVTRGHHVDSSSVNMYRAGASPGWN